MFLMINNIGLCWCEIIEYPFVPVYGLFQRSINIVTWLLYQVRLSIY